ncbi:acyl carrier protein [Nocardia jejuensis]|uniref:acyl carrier protein n=1 Tax=Nocardia jejuensis TaxID=328049 RepID=UPI00083118CC|nr:acyl carrier protein [Nocardia jejuensis]
MDTSREAIVLWCQEYLGNLLEMPANAVDPSADFDRLGVDSALAVALLIDVEDRYGIELSPEDLFENPNIDAVATYLHEQSRRSVA